MKLRFYVMLYFMFQPLWIRFIILIRGDANLDQPFFDLELHKIIIEYFIHGSHFCSRRIFVSAKRIVFSCSVKFMVSWSLARFD